MKKNYSILGVIIAILIIFNIFLLFNVVIFKNKFKSISEKVNQMIDIQDKAGVNIYKSDDGSYVVGLKRNDVKFVNIIGQQAKE